MTEFKQIIGRGTRIREDYKKLYFTIMDFKGATRLFADPKFDGEPVVIYEPKPDESVVPPEDVDDNVQSILKDSSSPTYETENDNKEEKGEGHTKYYLDDVDVRTAIERAQYLDADGRLITESYRVHLKDEIKKSLRAQFGTLTDFLRLWSEAERKQAVIDELKDQGILLEVLQEAIPDGNLLDVFDLIAHIAFDQKPLTRKERANNVKKRNYFVKYGDQAKAVLEGLLEKYADHGIGDIEDAKILELPPFDQLGTKTQIRRGIFGGADKYAQAITELEQALYGQMSA
jgi:type I restriction enzyme R subunit